MSIDRFKDIADATSDRSMNEHMAILSFLPIMNQTKTKWTEASVALSLRKYRYQTTSWASIRHCNQGTGKNCGRVLDMVCMNLWPSQGLHLHGIEIKVRRDDWKKELGDPAKAEALAANLHEFYIAAPAGVVETSEVPAGWGHLVVTDDGVAVAKSAMHRDVQPPSWEFLAALLRAATKAGEDVVLRSEVEGAIYAQVASIRTELESQHKSRVEGAVLEYKGRMNKAETSLRRIERVLGGSIEFTSDERLAEIGALAKDADAVKRALQRLAQMKPRVTEIENCLKTLVWSIDEAHAKLGEKD